MYFCIRCVVWRRRIKGGISNLSKYAYDVFKEVISKLFLIVSVFS